MKLMPFILFLVLSTFLPHAFSQAELPDPVEILKKAKEAVKNLESISYHAEHHVIGVIKLKEGYTFITPYDGTIKLARIHHEDPIGAKLIITLGNASKNQLMPVEISYDGKKIKKINKRSKIFYVNDPDDKGMYLLAGAEDLILDEFKTNDPFVREFSASEINYKGMAIIDGVRCHIIHFVFPEESQPRQVWWYLGAEDYLPRQVRKFSDRKPGEEYEDILTLSQLRPNIPIRNEEFNLVAPEDFQIKEYAGWGKGKPSLSIGDIAPAWTLSDPNGKQYSLGDYNGKIVVLDFWATWCLPCAKIMPQIQKIHDQFNDRGISVFGINIWDQGDAVKFMNKHGYSYAVLLKGDNIAKAYGVNAIPTMYVIGKDAKIIFAEQGASENLYGKVAAVLNDHLKAK